MIEVAAGTAVEDKAAGTVAEDRAVADTVAEDRAVAGTVAGGKVVAAAEVEAEARLRQEEVAWLPGMHFSLLPDLSDGL